MQHTYARTLINHSSTCRHTSPRFGIWCVEALPARALRWVCSSTSPRSLSHPCCMELILTLASRAAMFAADLRVLRGRFDYICARRIRAHGCFAPITRCHPSRTLPCTECAGSRLPGRRYAIALSFIAADVQCHLPRRASPAPPPRSRRCSACSSPRTRRSGSGGRSSRERRRCSRRERRSRRCARLGPAAVRNMAVAGSAAAARDAAHHGLTPLEPRRVGHP